MNYNVIEKFTSVNGEGIRSGQLTTFVRFKGCNLRCSYCDSSYTFDKNEYSEIMSEQQIIDYVRSTGSKNVTLAGGEPLFQKGIIPLIKKLCENDFSVEIETNGSFDIKEISQIEKNRPFITLDYKTSASGMEKHNLFSNYDYVNKNDCVKFVVGSIEDLQNAVQVCNKYDLVQKTNVLLSPVWEAIEPSEIVEFMKENKLNGYRLQLQIHKFIWNPDERGV